MIFYASGAITDEESLRLVVRHRIALLTSYAYKNAFVKQAPVLCRMLREERARLPYMLDSGAFTAWNKGKEVRRAALIDFYNWAVDEYGDVLDFTLVSLDRIPGKQGVERTAEDYKQAAEETVANYEYMRKYVRGYVKPVYHDGEPEWVLEHYKDAWYVSVSANQDLSYADREAWVARMAATHFAGRALHGLAMTGTRMLRTVRWHSVDSAAWVLWAGYGAVAWLRDDGSLKIMPASAESPRRKQFDSHLTTLPPRVRDRLVSEMEREGFTLEQLQEDSLARSRWNILVFHRACKWAEQQPVVGARQMEGLFDA